MTDVKRTREACHGCGRGAGSLRPVGLCAECRGKLDRFEELKKLIETDPARSVVLIPDRGYAYRYFGEGSSVMEGSSPSNMARDLADAFVEVLNAASIPLGEDNSSYGRMLFGQAECLNDSCGDWLFKRLIPTALIEPLNALERAVRQANVDAWNNGFASGKNLLAGLASGSMSTEEFNRLSTKSEKVRK